MTPCVEWSQSKDRDGYGRPQRGGKRVAAHRLAYAAAFGAIPDGLCVLHRCDNPACVNPEHLWLGTHQQNMADRDGKGRQVSNPRISREVIDRALAACALGENWRVVCKREGISKSQLYRVRNGEQRARQ